MNQNKFDNFETSRLCSKCWMKIFWLKKLSNFINYKEEETMNYNYYIEKQTIKIQECCLLKKNRQFHKKRVREEGNGEIPCGKKLRFKIK